MNDTAPSFDITLSTEPVLVLPAAVTIDGLDALLAELQALSLAPGAPLMLDASQMESITTPGVQLLLSLHQTLTQLGGRLMLHAPRAGMNEVFHSFGLAREYAQWSASSA